MITATPAVCRSSHSRPGFTLVEILAVVVILGVAAAIVIPQVSTRDDLQAASMARTVMSDLAYAQSRAVATQRRQYVRFDVVNNWYEVLDRLDPENVIEHPVNRTPFKVQIGPARTDSMKTVVFDEVTFDGRPILFFDELGTPHSYDPETDATSALAAGSVRLKSNEHTITITVEPYSGELKTN